MNQVELMIVDQITDKDYNLAQRIDELEILD
jgi:pterin-4a-carbinolamine dehydratase